MQLSGKNALVVGNNEIGRGLSHAGAKILFADRDQGNADRVAIETGGHALFVDVTQNTSVAGLAYHASDLLGEIDICALDVSVLPLEAAQEASRLIAKHVLPSMTMQEAPVLLLRTPIASAHNLLDSIDRKNIRSIALCPDGGDTLEALPNDLGAAAAYLCSKAAENMDRLALEVRSESGL